MIVDEMESNEIAISSVAEDLSIKKRALDLIFFRKVFYLKRSCVKIY